MASVVEAECKGCGNTKPCVDNLCAACRSKMACAIFGLCPLDLDIDIDRSICCGCRFSKEELCDWPFGLKEVESEARESH